MSLNKTVPPIRRKRALFQTPGTFYGKPGSPREEMFEIVSRERNKENTAWIIGYNWKNKYFETDPKSFEQLVNDKEFEVYEIADDKEEFENKQFDIDTRKIISNQIDATQHMLGDILSSIKGDSQHVKDLRKEIELHQKSLQSQQTFKQVRDHLEEERETQKIIEEMSAPKNLFEVLGEENGKEIRFTIVGNSVDGELSDKIREHHPDLEVFQIKRINHIDIL